MPRVLSGPFQRALVVENPHPSLDDLLQEGAFEEVVRVAEAPNAETLLKLLNEHRSQVLFKRSRVPVTREVLEGASDLMAIQLCCIGDDSIDKAAAAEQGVLIFNDPVSNGRSVVELVVANLIALSRRLYQSDRETHEGNWQKNNHERYEIRGKVLGIVGLGNIGRATARVCDALGMEICFYDNRRVAQEVGQEMGWRSADSLESLFESCDYVTLHPSAVDWQGRSNDGLITRELLMKLGSKRPENSPRIYLNLSRGFLHAPQDLLDAIEAGVIRRAAVDVYPSEPRAKGPGWTKNPYANEPRVICSPHIGAATQEAQPRIARRVSRTTNGFSERGAIRDCVYSPRTQISMADDLRAGRAVLVVVHSTTRGTKRALDAAIFEAGADNLRSEHQDLGDWGIAVDVNLLDRPLPRSALDSIAARTEALSGESGAVRSIRQVLLS